ncbi:MAG: hypothetical protein FJ265_18585 [Planctomycetes bacterium]|nr:hypothetical protein [Planctomycetota bacterium]
MLANALLQALPQIEIPPWAQQWLFGLGIGMAALFVLWLLATVVRAMHRRAYNLTKAETAPKTAADPAFLKVDEKARAEALQRGDAYARPAAGPAAEAAPAPSAPSLWGLFSRIGAVIIALAHVGVAVIAVAAMMKDADEVVQTVSTADGIRAVVSRYWFGLLLGLIVIIAEAVQFCRSRKAGTKR